MKLLRKEFIVSTGSASLAALFSLAGGSDKSEKPVSIPLKNKTLSDTELKNLSKADWDTIYILL